MKTLYKITLALAVMLITGSSFAQETEQDFAETTLNVILGDVYNITVGQSSVNINMNAPAHFISGNESTSQTNHLQITATSNYTVTVMASGTDFIGAGAIAVNNVKVVPVLGEDMSGNANNTPTFTAAPTDVFLNGTVAENLFTMDAGDLKRGIDVNYIIPADKAANFLDQPADTYTTTVTYTLMAE